MESYASRHEKRDFLKPYEWLTTEFSRGCKFHCDFCNFPILGVKGDYSRSQQDFETEMKYNRDTWGITDYYVADETFNDRVEKIRKFADVVEHKLDFQPYFSGFMRADLMITHREAWDDINRLGFAAHYYGIESFNDQSSKVVGKGMKSEKIKQGLIDYKNYMHDKLFYRATASFIVGLPYETFDTMAETRAWLLENWTDQAMISFPLDVGSIDDEHKMGSTNISDFTRNLLKYGLRKMTGPVPARNPDWPHRTYAPNVITKVADDELFVWEHDSMNLPQARQISDSLIDMSHDTFKLENWSLGMISFDQQKHLLDCDNLTTIGREAGRPAEDKLQSFLKEYIINKLNWKPE
jgi:hypothetical protein